MDRLPGEPGNGEVPRGSSKMNSVPSITAPFPPSFDSHSPSLQSEFVLGPPPSAGAFHTNFEVPSSPSVDRPNFSFGVSPTTAHSTPPSLYLTPPIQHASPTPDTPSFQPFLHRRSPSASFAPSSSSPRLGPVPMSPVVRSASPKRHNRIHSRNLSAFFPRPSAENATAIPEDEDSGQTLEYKAMDAPPSSARLSTFKFGGRLAPENGVHGGAPTKRRGHHHKHSVSHNFFSFMEPGQMQETEASPSLPESPFPGVTSTPNLSSGASERRLSQQPLPTSHKRLRSEHFLSGYLDDPERTAAVAFFAAEILLGCWLWIAGQFHGSLACTGLGYWIVFDSLGMTLSSKVFPSLWSGTQDVDLRKPFGTKRLETTASFAQSIYLVFSAVYILKEAVERFLLSSAGDDPHHHHSQAARHSLPTLSLWLSLGFLLLSNLAYRNHSHLVDAIGSLLPHPTTALASVPFLRPSARLVLKALHSSQLASRILSNQFTLAPTAFVLLLLYASYFTDQSQQMTFDMLVSSLEMIWTFSIAYPSAVSLGKILLQTAPERSSSGGSLESFQRVIREIQRDPRVLHVPDTHLWQLTHHRLSPIGANEAEELVSTVKVLVHHEASDLDILAITKWASDKISIALGKPRVGSVTVSVVCG